MIYNKPTTEITNLVESQGIMLANSELEITENIGAKKNDLIFDWDNDNEFDNLWAKEDNEEDS